MPGLDEPLPCPLCGYDLRGLPAGRCPECGHGFDPEALRAEIDALRRRREAAGWLTEYAGFPVIHGWARTVAVGLRPARFWRRVRPAMPVRPGRLAAHWALSAAAGAAAAWATAVFLDDLLAGDWPWHVFWEFTRVGVPVWAFGVAWPWLTLAALAVFRRTMRRARVRPGHPARCVVYAGDAVAWLPSAAVAVAAGFSWAGIGWPFGLLPHEWFGVLGTGSAGLIGIGAFAAVAGWRLWRAHALYLRLPHAAATVAAAGVVVLLAVATLIVLGVLRQIAPW